KLEVVDMDGKRIDKVLATPLTHPDADGETDAGEAAAMAAARQAETDTAAETDADAHALASPHAPDGNGKPAA
ncbi:MAG: hypothetical protein Q4E06_13155, partial [Lautropia sp.]|nr:hypothetical protein [Lautropia sp.]